MPKPARSNGSDLRRVNIVIPVEDAAALLQECRRLREDEAAYVPYGRVIKNLIRDTLPRASADILAEVRNERRPGNNSTTSAKRSKAKKPKTQ